MQPGQQPSQFDPTLPQQPSAMPTPMPTPTPLSTIPAPFVQAAAPAAPTPQFGQVPQISMNSDSAHHFPLWLIAVLVLSILGAGALVACAIVFMR